MVAGRVRGGWRAGCASLGLVTALLLPAPSLRAGDGAAAVAGRFNESLLSSMREAEELGYSGRHARLAPMVEATFDLSFMSERVLGQRWKDLSEEDRALWRKLFTDLLVATYAGRFVGYRGQHFENRGEQPAARDTVLVSTTLFDPGGENVDINYRFRRLDGEWRVVGIYLKGTAGDLALRRSEDAALHEREGFAALAEAVRKKITALERGEES